MLKEFEPRSFPCHMESGLDNVARGNDSRVYRQGDIVVKTYYKDFDKDLAFLYRDVTNGASALLESEPMFVDLPYSKQRFLLKINPYLNMRLCDKCQRMEGYMPYIEGKNLEERINEFDVKEVEVFLMNVGFLLQKKLGVSGIELLPLNIKLLGGNTLIITDLCANIDLLRKNV